MGACCVGIDVFFLRPDWHCTAPRRTSMSQPRPMGPGVAGGPTAAAVVAASEGKAKKYGLLGLLGVIRMTDPDLNTLALGSDLTTVGLNLDSAEVRERAGWLAEVAVRWVCLFSAGVQQQESMPCLVAGREGQYRLR